MELAVPLSESADADQRWAEPIFRSHRNLRKFRPYLSRQYLDNIAASLLVRAVSIDFSL